MFKQRPQPQTPGEKSLNTFRICRSNLLLVVGVTLINVILAAVQADRYFLFSAFLPYFLSLLGVEFAAEGVTFLFLACVALAVLLCVPYVVAYFCSKDPMKIGWFIACLVLFGVDTLVMFFFCGIDLSMILDYLFHVWILVYLIMGVRASAQLRRMPPEAFEPAAEAPEAAPEETATSDASDDTPSL